MNRPQQSSNVWPPCPLSVPSSNAADHFVFRDWRVEDARALAEGWADESVQHWLNPPNSTVEAAQGWIEGCEGRRHAGVALDVVVELDGSVAGEVGLSSFDAARRSALIGYWIAADYRGAGLAALAVTSLAGWFLGELGGKALLAQCHPANVVSQRVAERAGFTKLGVHDEQVVYVRR